MAVRGAVDAGRDLRGRPRRAGALGGRGRGGAGQRVRRRWTCRSGEVAITRRLNRAGEGEYRINGAKCRLTDVIEILSDTGLGKEMHSVVSQGRVAEIVTSKPRDRRMLIEEAAGLGKHRKRRRRAQLKLERTQDNLDRALDVEREARTRLKPLKRQAEAAELHERIERQMRRGALDAGPRQRRASARAALAAAEQAVAAARAAAAATEAELAAVGARREAAEEALSARSSERETLSSRFYSARSCGRADRRCGSTPRSAPSASWRSASPAAGRDRRAARPRPRRTRATTAPRSASPRCKAELDELAEDHRVRLERELAELEARREAATAARGRADRAGPGRRRPPRRGRSRRRGRPHARAASWTTPPRRPAASPRGSAPSWRRSTSSCAPTPAPRRREGPGRLAVGRPGLRARPVGRARPAPARRRSAPDLSRAPRCSRRAARTAPPR